MGTSTVGAELLLAQGWSIGLQGRIVFRVTQHRMRDAISWDVLKTI